MRKVIVESPYAGNVEKNIEYARACLKDCLFRGEAPFASHLLYTQPGVLDDQVDEERCLGISAELEIAKGFQATVVYTDLGVSPGMDLGMTRAKADGREIEFRRLHGEWGK